MHRHLIAIEVGVVGRTDEWMQLNCFALYQDRLESLDAKTMQCWGAIQKHRMLSNHFL